MTDSLKPRWWKLWRVLVKFPSPPVTVLEHPRDKKSFNPLNVQSAGTFSIVNGIWHLRVLIFMWLSLCVAFRGKPENAVDMSNVQSVHCSLGLGWKWRNAKGVPGIVMRVLAYCTWQTTSLWQLGCPHVWCFVIGYVSWCFFFFLV